MSENFLLLLTLLQFDELEMLMISMMFESRWKLLNFEFFLSGDNIMTILSGLD